MHRVLWLKLGGRRLHLLKTAGAFFMFFAVLKLAEALYLVFVTAQKAQNALWNPMLASQFFGWAIDATSKAPAFTGEDVLGVMLGPVAALLFWFGVCIVAIMIYQSGKVILPIEEYEQKISEHHRVLIRQAIEHAKKKKK